MSMICLTGDVHHMSLKPRHQEMEDGLVSEVDCLKTYLEITRRQDLKTTIFVTGKAVKEETNRLRSLIDSRVEVGGHTYSAFRPRILYGLASRFLKLSNGPSRLQEWDIGRTVKAIQDRLGIRIRTWRNHAYRHDRNTNRLLHHHGIQVVSDEVRPGARLQPLSHDGVVEVPINTTADHENMPHSCLTDHPLTSDAWVDRVMNEVRLLDSMGSTAVILAHPSCMYVEDRFEGFERLCAFLADYKSVFMSKVFPA